MKIFLFFHNLAIFPSSENTFLWLIGKNSCRPIWSVMILVINKSYSRCALSLVWLQTEFVLHSVLLLLLRGKDLEDFLKVWHKFLFRNCRVKLPTCSSITYSKLVAVLVLELHGLMFTASNRVELDMYACYSIMEKLLQHLSLPFLDRLSLLMKANTEVKLKTKLRHNLRKIMWLNSGPLEERVWES